MSMPPVPLWRPQARLLCPNLTGFCFIGKAVLFQMGSWEKKKKNHVDLLGSRKPDYKGRERRMCVLPRQVSGAWKEGRMMGHLQDCVRGVKCCIPQSARKGCVCVREREKELGFYIMSNTSGSTIGSLPSMSSLF